MARLPRFVLVGHPQHVIIRGNNREPIFYASVQEVLTAQGFYEPEFRRDHTNVSEEISEDCFFKLLKAPKSNRSINLTDEQINTYNEVDPSKTHDVIVVRTNSQEYSTCISK